VRSPSEHALAQTGRCDGGMGSARCPGQLVASDIKCMFMVDVELVDGQLVNKSDKWETNALEWGRLVPVRGKRGR
jgi:hypothetical protein